MPLSISLGLGITSRGAGIPPIISAVITPTIGTMLDGYTLFDNTGWEDFEDTLNYTSTAGTISSVVMAVTGTGPVDETTVLDAGDTAGFTVTVTDSAANVRVYTIGPVAVAATVAGAPTGLSATPGDTEVDLSWTAPANDGGAALTDYLIERNIAAAGWTTVTDGVGTGTTYTDTGLTNDVAHQYRVSAINSVGTSAASSTQSATPTETDVTAPAMTSLTLGTQQTSGNVPITITALTENCTAFWSLTTTDQSAATPAQVIAGGLTNEVDSGNFSAAIGGGPYSEALTSGLSGNHYIQVALRDASMNVSTLTYSDGPVAIDTTAPVLSSVSTTPGDTEANLDWSTDTGSGTAYWIADTTATQTAAYILANGTSVAVSGTGAQTQITQTGLTNGVTYYFHLVHVDAVANQSTVSNTSVVPAASSGSLELHTSANQSTNLSTGQTDSSFTGAFLNSGDFIVAIGDTGNGSRTWTLGGSNVSAVSLLGNTLSAGTYDCTVAMYRVTTTAASTLTLTLTGSDSFTRNVTICEAIGLDFASVDYAVNALSSHPTTAGTAPTVTGAPAGAHALAMSVSRQAQAQSCVWGGDFASGDEITDMAINANSCASAALVSGIASGDFAPTATFNTSDGTGSRAGMTLIIEDA